MCVCWGGGSCIAVGAAGCSVLWGRVAGVTVCVYVCVRAMIHSTESMFHPPPALPLVRSVVQM